MGGNGESVAYFVNESIIEGQSHHIEIEMDYPIIASVESGSTKIFYNLFLLYSIEK